MKKVMFLFAVMALVFTATACDRVEDPEYGDYLPGLHLGYTDGHQNTYAYVYVDSLGYIADIFIDTVYMKSDEEGPVTWEGRGGDEATGYATTKMSLDHGCGYDMWPREDTDYCEAPEGHYMWHEQVRMLAEDIIDNQGIINYDLDDGYFDEDGDDVIAGVTITVDSYLEAVQNALELAELPEGVTPGDVDVPTFDNDGDYEPGINFGYTEGHQNTIAVVAVDEDGFIVHIGIDTIYLKSNDGPLTWEGRSGEVTGYATTKMSLDHGCGYDMWPREDTPYCEAPEGNIMWHEQVAMLADDIIANQGVINYDLDDGYFDEDGDDVIAGVTITVESYIAAVEAALE